MKVRELKTRLKDISDELEVVAFDDETGDFYNAEGELLTVSKYDLKFNLTYYKDKHYPEMYGDHFPTPPRVEVFVIR